MNTPAPGALNIALTLGKCSLITGFNAYGLITRSGSLYSLTAYGDASCSTASKITTFNNVAVGACSTMDTAPLGLYIKLSNSVTINNVWAGDKTCSVAATAQAAIKDIPVGAAGSTGICTSIALAGLTGSILATEMGTTGVMFSGFPVVGCPTGYAVLNWMNANYNNCTASDAAFQTAYFYISTGSKNNFIDTPATDTASTASLAIGLGVGLGVGIPFVAAVWWFFSKSAAPKAPTTIRSPETTAV